MEMQIRIPEQVNMIIEKLLGSGFEAYVVGGCVRDALLGREPHDWDITTSALPQEVKAIFPRTIDTGLKHGTVISRPVLRRTCREEISRSMPWPTGNRTASWTCSAAEKT